MSRNAYAVLWRGNAFWVEGMEGNAKIPGGGGGEAPLGTPPFKGTYKTYNSIHVACFSKTKKSLHI